MVIPVSPAFNDYAEEVANKMKAAGLLADADLRNEKMGYKIREHQLQKVPYMLIVGENEMNDNAVSVRRRGGIDLGTMGVDAFIAQALDEVNTKTIW